MLLNTKKKCECFSECDLAEGGPLHMLRAPGHFDQHVACHKSFSIIDIVQVVSIRLWGGGLMANEALKEFPPPVGISYLILERGTFFLALLNIWYIEKTIMQFCCMEKNSLNIIQNISFCVSQKSVSKRLCSLLLPIIHSILNLMTQILNITRTFI